MLLNRCLPQPCIRNHATFNQFFPWPHKSPSRCRRKKITRWSGCEQNWKLRKYTTKPPLQGAQRIHSNALTHPYKGALCTAQKMIFGGTQHPFLYLFNNAVRYFSNACWVNASFDCAPARAAGGHVYAMFVSHLLHHRTISSPKALELSVQVVVFWCEVALNKF